MLNQIIDLSPFQLLKIIPFQLLKLGAFLKVCKRRNELRDYKQNKCVRGAMNCATTNKTSV